MSFISWSRSPETTSWIVRTATWLRSPLLMRWDSSAMARGISPLVAV